MYWCDFLEGATRCCSIMLLHLPLIWSILIPNAASTVYECSLTGLMPLQSVGQAAGEARGGDEVTPGLIREQCLPRWLYQEKDGALACLGSGSLICMQDCVPPLYWDIKAVTEGMAGVR